MTENQESSKANNKNTAKQSGEVQSKADQKTKISEN
jgi:hypothetical protein